MGLGLQQSDGKPLTEEFLREHLKVDKPKAKKTKTKKKKKDDETTDETCCSAVVHQRSMGDYAKARCSKSGCTRDDGNANLLCEECGARWDTVSSNDIGGQICYAAGAHAKKKGYGGAEWLGIYDKDCPPVFLGQSCGVKDEKGKWDMRASLDKVSKGGERRNGAFHTPLTPWDTAPVCAVDTQDTQGKTEQMEEDSSDAESIPGPPPTYDLEGAHYIEMTHGDKVYLYRVYGDDPPDPTVKGNASACIKPDGKVGWMDDDDENLHDEYVATLSA